MPRSVKVLELVVAALAGLTAVGFYVAGTGPNAAEAGLVFQIGCLVGMVVFELYATTVMFDALFGEFGLICDIAYRSERKRAMQNARRERGRPVGRRGMLARHPSPRIRRRRMAAR